jgi:hypothetical protein
VEDVQQNEVERDLTATVFPLLISTRTVRKLKGVANGVSEAGLPETYLSQHCCVVTLAGRERRERSEEETKAKKSRMDDKIEAGVVEESVKGVRC